MTTYCPLSSTSSPVLWKEKVEDGQEERREEEGGEEGTVADSGSTTDDRKTLFSETEPPCETPPVTSQSPVITIAMSLSKKIIILQCASAVISHYMSGAGDNHSHHLINTERFQAQNYLKYVLNYYLTGNNNNNTDQGEEGFI